jgi:hypothetical protein
MLSCWLSNLQPSTFILSYVKIMNTKFSFNVVMLYCWLPKSFHQIDTPLQLLKLLIFVSQFFYINYETQISYPNQIKPLFVQHVLFDTLTGDTVFTSIWQLYNFFTIYCNSWPFVPLFSPFRIDLVVLWLLNPEEPHNRQIIVNKWNQSNKVSRVRYYH